MPLELQGFKHQTQEVFYQAGDSGTVTPPPNHTLCSSTNGEDGACSDQVHIRIPPAASHKDSESKNPCRSSLRDPHPDGQFDVDVSVDDHLWYLGFHISPGADEPACQKAL